MIAYWVKPFIAASITAILALTTMCTVAQAQEQTSFRSANYPYHYIRHRSSLGYIDKIEANDSLGRKDATFRLVPGLAGM